MSKALKIAQQAKDEICIGCSYRGLGEVYAALGDFDKAKKNFSFSLKAFEQAGDRFAALEVKKLIDRHS